VSELWLRRFDEVRDFEDVVFPFLLEREAEHNVILGICNQIKLGDYSEFWLTAVLRDSTIVAVAYRTPPFLIGLAHAEDPGGIDVIVEAAHAEFGTLPGAAGSKTIAARFSEAWSRVSGQSSSLRMEQRIYQAETVRGAVEAPGHSRPATESDAALLAEWVVAFGEEAHAPAARPPSEWLRSRLEQDDASGIWVWEDEGEVVSMVAYSGPTPNGIRVNAVYTPPDRRQRGYATASVAALTQWLLDGGRRFCFLYTDLANPTSNAIYQRIGYEPVSDVDQYAFT
jgi:predicted GNAT family acetyltransferase